MSCAEPKTEQPISSQLAQLFFSAFFFIITSMFKRPAFLSCFVLHAAQLAMLKIEIDRLKIENVNVGLKQRMLFELLSLVDTL